MSQWRAYSAHPDPQLVDWGGVVKSFLPQGLSQVAPAFKSRLILKVGAQAPGLPYDMTPRSVTDPSVRPWNAWNPESIYSKLFGMG